MRNGVEAASHWRDRSVFGDRVQFMVHSTNISISSELKFDTVSLIFYERAHHVTKPNDRSNACYDQLDMFKVKSCFI